MCEIYATSRYTLATCIRKAQMKHTSETSETLKAYACNMPLKQLQHPPIYFCNIHMKQIQHAFETSETLETYICNIWEGKVGRSIPPAGVGGSSIARVKEGTAEGGEGAAPGWGRAAHSLQHRRTTAMDLV